MADKLRPLQERLQYRFKDGRLLVEALTHASATARGRPSNERLEFLGDAVVGLVVCEFLWRCRPSMSEGEMTVVKSAVVSRSALTRVARTLGLAEFLTVDEGMRQQKGYPGSIMGNAYEAVVGAMFLDRGLGKAAEFVMRTLEPEIERARSSQHTPSFKSVLQHRTQAEGKGAPRYRVVRHEGPDHLRRYLTVVQVGGKEQGTGWGLTKKDAEQNAARDTLDRCYPGWDAEGEKKPARTRRRRRPAPADATP
jgi:ribonuclease-3